MDFAKKQLEKYGWSEGKGLGKNEDGISTALKPKLKFDNSGVGHDVGEQFTNNWWETLFNSAAKNIDVHSNKDGVKVKVKDVDSVEITTKNYSVKKLKKNKNLEYGSFLKTAKLTENGVQDLDVGEISKSEPDTKFKVLSDEELFAACGGRTAHKGARHGLKQSGKLSRIEKQERLLLRKMRKVSLSDDNTASEKKLKKLKKQKQAAFPGQVSPEENMEATTSRSPSLKKYKNKKRKSVSFNETVTKYYTAELDTSFDSEIGSLKDENSNRSSVLDLTNGLDEGIEQDLENNNNDQEDNHRSFEEAQFNFNDLSKAERKKLQKKRKLEAKKSGATQKFLQGIVKNDVDASFCVVLHVDENDGERNKKRKLDLLEFEDTDSLDSKKSQSLNDLPEKSIMKKGKKKRKKEKKLEDKLCSITKSLNNVCRIADDE